MGEIKRILPAEVWEKGMTYAAYFELLEELLKQGKTTGEHQIPERTDVAPLNLARMKRLKQKVTAVPEVIDALKSVSAHYQFLFIVEGWCGDAAQVVPVLENVVQTMGWESRYILRDEFPEVMDMFLTNGTRSIPVVVALDANLNVVGSHWGPRPAVLQDLVNHWKVQMSKEDWHKELHSWYAVDKGEQMQKDFTSWMLSLQLSEPV